MKCRRCNQTEAALDHDIDAASNGRLPKGVYHRFEQPSVAEIALDEVMNLVADARLRSPEDVKKALERVYDVLRKAEHARRVEMQVCGKCGTERVPVLYRSRFVSDLRMCGECHRHEPTERFSLTPEGEASLAIDEVQAVAS